MFSILKAHDAGLSAVFSRLIMSQRPICRTLSSLNNEGERKLSLYDILGVSSSADNKQIKEAFLKMSKKTHPDLNPDNEEASENFRKLAAAYEVLSDPQSRNKYDIESGIKGRMEKTSPGHFKQGFTTPTYGVHSSSFGRKIEVDLSPERMSKAWEAYKLRWAMEEQKLKDLEEKKKKFRNDFDRARGTGFQNMTAEEIAELKENMRCLRIPKSMLNAKEQKTRQESDSQRQQFKKRMEEMFSPQMSTSRDSESAADSKPRSEPAVDNQEDKINVKHDDFDERRKRTKKIDLGNDDIYEQTRLRAERLEQKYKDTLFSEFQTSSSKKTRTEEYKEYFTEAMNEQRKALKNAKEAWDNSEFFAHTTTSIHSGPTLPRRLEFKKFFVYGMIFVTIFFLAFDALYKNNPYDDNVFLKLEEERLKKIKAEGSVPKTD